MGLGIGLGLKLIVSDGDQGAVEQVPLRGSGRWFWIVRRHVDISLLHITEGKNSGEFCLGESQGRCCVHRLTCDCDVMALMITFWGQSSFKERIRLSRQLSRQAADLGGLVAWESAHKVVKQAESQDEHSR